MVMRAGAQAQPQHAWATMPDSTQSFGEAARLAGQRLLAVVPTSFAAVLTLLTGAQCTHCRGLLDLSDPRLVMWPQLLF